MSGTSVAARTIVFRRWLALVLLCAVQFVVVLGISIVNITLPSVEEDLGFSEQCLQGVVSGNALTFGGFLLLAGRAVALFGRRRDECEEAASKREDSQEISAYLAEC